jgi:hypothetical protein
LFQRKEKNESHHRRRGHHDIDYDACRRPIRAVVRLFQAPSALKAKSKKTEATRSYAREYRVSPYSFNPAHDVYVNGNYVGSDPDPRVRATLKNEERSQGGMR